MNDVVHIAYMCSDLSSDYNRHTGAAIASALENCSRPAIIHILYDKLYSDANPVEKEREIGKYQSLVQKYDAEIQFHAIDFPEWLNSDHCVMLKQWRRIPFSAFYLPELLPDVNRVILLESDTIVQTDVSKLLETLPETYSIGGHFCKFSRFRCFIDCLPGNFLYCFKKLGGNIHEYINGGVVLFNLNRIRNRIPNLSEKALDIIWNNQDKLIITDGLLSFIFTNDIFCLDHRFNYEVSGNDNSFSHSISESILNDIDGYILHYCVVKPWDRICSPLDKKYYHYLLLTPWCDEKILDYMFPAIVTREQYLTAIDEWIWMNFFPQKVKLLLDLSIGQYIKLLKRYLSQIFS